VGSSSRPFPQGSSYSRPPQLRGGPVIKGRPSGSRLVHTHSGDSADLAAVLQGADRSVGQQTEHLLPSLVLARGRQPPLGIDTLSHQWPSLRLYAFPPVPLLQQVLGRVANEGRELLLIAPHWPSQLWVADLINMSVQQPWEL